MKTNYRIGSKALFNQSHESNNVLKNYLPRIYIMAALNGLRFFQRSAAFYNATIKASNRTRRLPEKIFYYSRFVSQLKQLRSKEHSRQALGTCSQIPENLSDQDLDTIKSSSCEVSQESSNPANDDEKQSPIVHDSKSPFRNKEDFTENDYIYRHVHRRLDYLANMGDQLDTLPINSEIAKLKQIQQNAELSELDRASSTQETLDSIQINIKSMNQQELAILLSGIKQNHSRDFIRVKRMVDIELRWLLKKHVNTRLMDIDLWFYLADVFYEASMRSTFVHVLVNYLAAEKDVVLSNQQFLHLLFLVILQKQHAGILLSYEQRILRMLKTASFGDIVTICMAYFKTMTRIENSDILRRIIEQTIEYLPDIDPKESGYCSIVKCLRYSRNLEVRDNVSSLILTLVDGLDNRLFLKNNYNAVHTVKLMETYRIYEPKMLDQLARILFADLDQFRIKDIQYSLTSLSNFAYKDLRLSKQFKQELDYLCDRIVAEDRPDAHHQYFHLMPLLRAFSIFGYYNDKLLEYTNHVLEDPEKFHIINKALESERSALLVYVATKLEGAKNQLESSIGFFKDMNNRVDRFFSNMGSVRQDSSIKHLSFILSNKIPKSHANTVDMRVLAQRLSECKELQDQRYKVNFQFTFPHQNFGDCVVSDEHKEPGHFDATTLMPKQVPPGQKHCVLLVTRKRDYVDGFRRLCGYKQLISRLLTKLGYNVMTVDLEDLNLNGLAKKIKLALDDRE